MVKLNDLATKQPTPQNQFYSIPGVDMTNANFIENLQISKIDPYPNNRELSDAAVASLAADIKENGVLQPILVRPKAYGRYELLAGHHRVSAVKTLDEETVPAFVLELEDADAERAVLSTNAYMIPAWSSEERGAQWMAFTEIAEKRRNENKEKYAGVRTDEIVAQIAKENGYDTSWRQVTREKKAYKTAKKNTGNTPEFKITPDWQELFNTKKITDQQAALLEKFTQQEQQNLYDKFTELKGSKSWLDCKLAAKDADLTKKLTTKYQKQLAQITSYLEILKG